MSLHSMLCRRLRRWHDRSQLLVKRYPLLLGGGTHGRCELDLLDRQAASVRALNEGVCRLQVGEIVLRLGHQPALLAISLDVKQVSVKARHARAQHYVDEHRQKVVRARRSAVRLSSAHVEQVGHHLAAVENTHKLVPRRFEGVDLLQLCHSQRPRALVAKPLRHVQVLWPHEGCKQPPPHVRTRVLGGLLGAQRECACMQFRHQVLLQPLTRRLKGTSVGACPQRVPAERLLGGLQEALHLRRVQLCLRGVRRRRVAAGEGRDERLDRADQLGRPRLPHLVEEVAERQRRGGRRQRLTLGGRRSL
mmetsp:Transcript_17745/g.55138  ORF Transcript_17745/g.55138 Transcript_17745/m.55138 type:complete len:306 (-) Transcript_17745:135-1052(-)